MKRAFLGKAKSAGEAHVEYAGKLVEYIDGHMQQFRKHRLDGLTDAEIERLDGRNGNSVLYGVLLRSAIDVCVKAKIEGRAEISKAPDAEAAVRAMDKWRRWVATQFSSL